MRGTRERLAFLLLLPMAAWSWSCGAGESALQGGRNDIDAAVARVYPALVRIDVVSVAGEAGRLRKGAGAGSGAIISPEGYVITNHHVAGRAVQIRCRLSDGREVPARLVGTDALADVAVIQLDRSVWAGPARPLAVAEFGDSDRLRVGDVVLAMGSPMAVSQSVTKGIVSNTQMIMPDLLWFASFSLDGESVGSLVRWIGHDAVIYGGNSGGPLVDLRGRIVGINEIGLGSLGGAIPSNLARDVAWQLIRTGTVERSWTGLEAQPRLRQGGGPCGVLVGGVIADSPAAKAGLKPGDVITAYDGLSVDCRVAEELPLFNRLLLSTPVGKTVRIDALREGKAHSFTLTTVVRGKAQADEVELSEWGLAGRDLTALSAMEKRCSRDGVQVQSVRAGGPAGEAKPALEEGDVITQVAGKAVRNLAELRQATREAMAGKPAAAPVLVAFDRNDARMLTVVRVGSRPSQENPAQPSRPWLGAATQALTRDLAEALGLKGRGGVRLTQIVPGSPAERAGLKVGDVLLKLEGTKIDVSRPEEVEVFANLIRQYRVGTQVELDLVREGKAQKAALTLGPAPTPPNELRRYCDEQFEFTARDLAQADRQAEKLGDDVRGVKIERVEHAGWAFLAHLALGDVLLSVNGKPTPTAAELETALGEIKKRQPASVVFFVRRGIHTMFLEVEPKWEAP